jgi:hypothetical protein
MAHRDAGIFDLLQNETADHPRISSSREYI